MVKKITPNQTNPQSHLSNLIDNNSQNIQIQINHFNSDQHQRNLTQQNTLNNQHIQQHIQDNSKQPYSIVNQHQIIYLPFYYRITSYLIDNKTYRLVSLNQQFNQDQQYHPYNHQNPINNQNDFRQPILDNPILPRFNFFNRFNRNNRPNNNRLIRPHNRRQYRNRKSYFQQLLSYSKNLYRYIKSVQLSSILQYMPFYRYPSTLQSKYKYVSFAILNNSINLQSAIIKALQYNIPLMQIIINPKNEQQQKIVVQKILTNFTIGHFINQNFVLYGDWNYSKYEQTFINNFNQQVQQIIQKQIKQKQASHFIDSDIYGKKQKQYKFSYNGKIVFRKGQIAFAQIDLPYVNKIDDNQFQQKLQQIRNHYYKEKQLYRNPNSLLSESYNQTDSSLQYQNSSQLRSENNQQNNSHSQQSYNQYNQNNHINQNLNNKNNQQQNSSSKRQPRTIKQIEQQILNDYLQQKMKQQLIYRQKQQIEQQYSDEEQFYNEQSYPDSRNSFLIDRNRSSKQNSNPQSMINSRRNQQKSQKKQQTIQQQDQQDQSSRQKPFK